METSISKLHINPNPPKDGYEIFTGFEAIINFKDGTGHEQKKIITLTELTMNEDRMLFTGIYNGGSNDGSVKKLHPKKREVAGHFKLIQGIPVAFKIDMKLSDLDKAIEEDNFWYGST